MGIKMKDDFYLTAYEGVEDLSNFSCEGDVALYREHVLEETYPQRDFIEKRIEPTDCNIFEVGCGNGRLLIALHRENRSLYGIDISKTRIRFAQQWIKDLNLGEEIMCTVEDILHLNPARLEKTFDVLFCITRTFAFFDAIAEEGGEGTSGV